MANKMTRKMHYKMYKSGKKWVIGGIVSGSLMFTLGVTAQAAVEPVDTAVATTAVSTAVEETPVVPAVTEPTAEETTTAATTESAATTVVMPADGAATDAVTVTKPMAGATPVELAETATDDQSVTTSGADEAAATTKPMTAVTTVPTTDAAVPVDLPAEEMPAITEPTTKPETAVTSVEPVVLPEVATVATTRPAEMATVVVDSPLATLGADVMTAATALVQKELTKPATMTLTHTKETAMIDLWMPNKRLQQLVLLTLQKLPGTGKTWNSVADITQEDMALLKSLSTSGRQGLDTYIDGKTAYSLVGLEYAVNLTAISMGGSLNDAPGAFYGDIEDLTPIANLQQLTSVDFQHNRIKDVTPLVNLQNLQSVYLAYNAIRDFSPLNGKFDHTSAVNFSYTGQFIFLDPIMISDKDREGHLQVACTTITGEVVPLTATAAIAQPIFFVNGAHTYHVYFTGGNPKPDGQGGIYYTNIQNQKPGATEWSGDASVNVEPMKDYYYLTGMYKPNGVVDFSVVQPYAIAQSAANVTVHYVNEDGETIAPDRTLKPGLVGEAYTTEPAKVPNYVLQVTPENATGTYGETAIDVTYVYAEEDADTQEPGNPTPPTSPENPGSGDGGSTTTPGPDNPAPEGPSTGDDSGAQPGGQNPGTGDDGVTEGDEADTVTPETPGDHTGAGTTSTGNGGTSTGQAADVATAPGGSQEQAATSALAGDQVLSAGIGSALLPQTNEERRSPMAWGMALLVGLLGLTSLKRRSKNRE